MRCDIDSSLTGRYHSLAMAARTKRGQRMLLLLLVVLPCALLASMFWYPLKGARVAHKSLACMNNLRHLGIAMNSYREANGHFPPKLSGMYPKYISDPNVFSCPGDPHEIRNPRDIDSLSGYVLLAVDTSDTNSFDWIDKPLLCDRRRNHLGKMNGVSGGNILYADGHVQWMPDVHPTEPSTIDIVTSNFSFGFPD